MIKVDGSKIIIHGRENEIAGELGVIMNTLKNELGTEKTLRMIQIVMEEVFEGELKIEGFRVNKKENTGKKDIEEIKEILDKLPDDLSKMLKHLLQL